MKQDDDDVREVNLFELVVTVPGWRPPLLWYCPGCGGATIDGRTTGAQQESCDECGNSGGSDE